MKDRLSAEDRAALLRQRDRMGTMATDRANQRRARPCPRARSQNGILDLTVTISPREIDRQLPRTCQKLSFAVERLGRQHRRLRAPRLPGIRPDRTPHHRGGQLNSITKEASKQPAKPCANAATAPYNAAKYTPNTAENYTPRRKCPVGNPVRNIAPNSKACPCNHGSHGEQERERSQGKTTCARINQAS